MIGSNRNRLHFVTAAAVLIGCLVSFGVSSAQEVINVYGPGGPYPAMKEAAEVFSKAHGVKVEIGFGPAPKWIDKAKSDAHIVYSGSEHMLSDYIKLLDGRIDENTIKPLYLRPSAILVRPGNPKQIKDFPDLLKPGVKVLVVQGAGQTGMWEDMAGRRGNIETVRALRKNIVSVAPDSATAKQTWINDKNIDAWIIYNIWQKANPDLADLVPVSDDYVIYRGCSISLTKQGTQSPSALEFVKFVQSPQGAEIFSKWGWKTK